MADADTGPTATAGEAGEPLAWQSGLGTTLGRYILTELVGVGGMGLVLRARDPTLDRDLAIKVVTAAGSGNRGQILREAQAMARLRTPGVVPIYDVGEFVGGIFIVMPHLAGGSLARWLRTPRPWREVLARFIAAGRGLAAAHAAGLIHRDFKPDNVLLDEHDHPLVADLGLARAAGDTAGPPIGTPAYMPPEQLLGRVLDPRADVFAFCVSLYEGLYGVRPFRVDHARGAVAGRLEAIYAQAIETRSDRDVPRWLRSAVVRGLAADRDDRWPSMDALLGHLVARRRRPRRAALIVAAALVVTAAAALATMTWTARPVHGRGIRRPSERITARGDVRYATLDPDGRRLAMTTTTGDLVVRDLDGAGEERVVARDLLMSAAWSSDGRRLVYVASDGVIHALTVATGDDTIAGDGGGWARVIGDDLVVAWWVNHETLRFFDLGSPGPGAPPRWSCAVPGQFRWLLFVVPRSDGTLFVATGDDVRHDHVDRIRIVDRHCAVLREVAAGLDLGDVAPRAHRDHLIAETAGAAPRLVELDDAGHLRPLDAAIPERPHGLVGVDDRGRILLVERAAIWRLLRVGPTREPRELASGSLGATIAVAPDGTRYAEIETAGDRGGALRVVDLANPTRRGPVLEPHALAVGWYDHDVLAAVVARGSDATLVVEDATGHRRAEHPVPRPSAEGVVVRIGETEVAYGREDSRTYVVVDVASGATRLLVDPGRGFISALTSSPRDHRLLAWWRRSPQPGVYRIDPPDRGERLPVSAEGQPVWSAAGDAVFVVSQMPARIDRFDPASEAITPYLTDLSPRYDIVRASATDDGDLFVQVDEPNADVFAQGPDP